MAKKPSKTRSVKKGRSRQSRAAGPTDEAQFVFRGTVLQLGATTLEEVPAGPGILAARVDRITRRRFSVSS